MSISERLFPSLIPDAPHAPPRISLNPGERIEYEPLAPVVRELIASQVVLVQAIAELAESIRVLAEAIGEPEADEESMVMSRKR